MDCHSNQNVLRKIVTSPVGKHDKGIREEQQYELLFCIICNVLLEGQCIEPRKSSAITMIKPFGLITGDSLTREVWTDCLGSRVRLALSISEKTLKLYSSFYSLYVF